MSVDNNLVTIVNNWWQFAVFLGGTIIAFVIGRERQRFRVDQVGHDVELLSKKVDAQSREIVTLQAQGTTSAVTLAKIMTTQTYIVTTLEEIKDALKRKADK